MLLLWFECFFVVIGTVASRVLFSVLASGGRLFWLHFIQQIQAWGKFWELSEQKTIGILCKRHEPRTKACLQQVNTKYNKKSA